MLFINENTSAEEKFVRYNTDIDQAMDLDGDGQVSADEIEDVETAAELADLSEAAVTVERLMRENALSAITYFEGGDQAVHNFCESCEIVDSRQPINEARKMGKNTYVRLGKDDDLTRRTNMACLMLAKKNNDPLFKKLAKNRVMEKMLRKKIFAKYGSRAVRVAKLSQKQHIKDMRKLPALPKIKL